MVPFTYSRSHLTCTSPCTYLSGPLSPQSQPSLHKDGPWTSRSVPSRNV